MSTTLTTIFRMPLVVVSARTGCQWTVEAPPVRSATQARARRQATAAWCLLPANRLPAGYEYRQPLPTWR